MNEREYCEAAERHRLAGYNGDDHEPAERDPDSWEMFWEGLQVDDDDH